MGKWSQKLLLIIHCEIQQFEFKYIFLNFFGYKVKILWQIDWKTIFRLSFTSEERIFDPNLELKFQISQSLGKCFEYNLREISILDIPGAKIFFWEWNLKIFYFDISMDKMIYFEKIYNLWKSYQSGTLIPNLSKYCNNNQTILKIEKTNNFFMKNVILTWILWTYYKIFFYSQQI